jgi:hypothetical protein
MTDFDNESESERAQRIANQYRKKAIQTHDPQEAAYNDAKADIYEEKARMYREQGE